MQAPVALLVGLVIGGGAGLGAGYLAFREDDRQIETVCRTREVPNHYGGEARTVTSCRPRTATP